ncbi:hypothetical protein [Streptomyces sp. NPDC057381]|uniref:hypothetical protein n=1 Tax=Streptomyces sp. NPDC057381 TaxID=3346111 RepID=UPI003640AE4C
MSSGYALQLSFGLLEAMVRSMCLAREAKYPLLLKMVQHLYELGGALPPGENPRAALSFGAFLPTDRAGTLVLVARGVQGKVLCLETGIRLLLEAGFPVEDVTAEAERLRDQVGSTAEQNDSSIPAPTGDRRERCNAQPAAGAYKNGAADAVCFL